MWFLSTVKGTGPLCPRGLAVVGDSWGWSARCARCWRLGSGPPNWAGLCGPRLSTMGGRYQRSRAHFWDNRQIVPVCAEAGIARRDMPELPRVKPKLAMVALLASLPGQTSRTCRSEASLAYGMSRSLCSLSRPATPHDHRRRGSRRASQTVELQQPSRGLVPTGEH